ncbi:MAG: membrane protein insertase YidC [Pseudomonadota bacterium]|nr:membrane protein insertase YidC [Pseudomonadota bacterium]
MTDIRRTILWVVFSASLFLIWDSWQRHNGEPSFLSPRPASTGAGVSPPQAVPAGKTTAVAAAPSAGASQAGAPAPGQLVKATTDVYEATFDSTGAALVGLVLRREQEHVERPWYASFQDIFGGAGAKPQSQDIVLFDRSADRYYVAQTGLWPSASGPGALPEHHSAMTPVPGERTLKDGVNELQVRFESAEVGGVKLVKTYTLRRGDYAIGVRHEVVNGSAAPISPLLYLQLVRDGNAPPGGSGFYSTFTGPAIYTDTKHYDKIDFKTIEKRDDVGKIARESASSGWVAMVQHYFAAAWLLDKAAAPASPWQFFTGKVDANTYSVGMLVPIGEVAAGTTRSIDAKLFAGPQEEDKLAALAPGLELVKDYGIFKILAEPLFWLLTQLHKLFGNWGWAIVGLVVLLKIAFFWLNAKAYGSMAKMKAINPRIMEMRARLKDKPQQMQQEMMRIYKEEKVNPLGGCLPIVAQMPFFLALYWVLLSTVEMRNAPWIGWIHDLSARDPFFILPLLMTGTSLLQTWLNPTPPDPVQAKMMWMMPLIFSVMFFFFPAGLVLYWLTNNILSIAQQYVINKRLGVIGK